MELLKIREEGVLLPNAFSEHADILWGTCN